MIKHLKIKRIFVPFLLSMLLCYCINMEAKQASSLLNPFYINFDNNWYFIQNDSITTLNDLDRCEKYWRLIRIPHDWSIDGVYDKTANGTDWQSGFLPCGMGWYKKTFDCPDTWSEKRIRIRFDGVYVNSKVWINGHLLGSKPNGYIGFEYDLTPFLQAKNNEIIVQVDQTKPLTGRWYTGSGIYRHVALLVSAPTHFNYSGICFQTDTVNASKACYNVSIEMTNQSQQPVCAEVILTDMQGNIADKRSVKTSAINENILALQGEVYTPMLWSPDTPNVYKLTCLLKQGDELLDVNEQWVGFRSFSFSAQQGMLLNGEPIKLKGVCDHHTAGAIGAALREDVLHYRLSLLKQMGCNAIRTAHNPFAPEFYAMCDTMGFIVMNEGLDGWETPKARDDYGNYFNTHWKEDLTAFIKRDRNHPSVFIWSIGNEVVNPTPQTQKKLVDLFHQLDPTRPVTQGGTDPTRGMVADYDKNFRSLDLIGFNGNGEEVGELEMFHQQMPLRCAVATEVPHTYQTRGVYRTKTQWRRRDFPAPWEINSPVKWDEFEHRVFPIADLSETECFPEEAENIYYQSAYDNASVRISVRKSWQRTSSFPWLIGEFRWGSFDYLGEAEWPQRCGNFGIIDVAAMPKDAYYLYQSLWSKEPMLHLLPHWTLHGKEGMAIPVVAYTNCDSVALFINNQLLKTLPYTGEQLAWQVPYQPGTIKAVAYKGGKVMVEKEIKTSYAPAQLAVSTNKTTIRSNSNEVVRVEIEVTDKNGAFCPLAANELRFSCNGPIRILGVDNGDPIDHFLYKGNRCKAFRGKCVVLLESNGEQSGNASLSIEGDNLTSKQVDIVVTK